MTATLQQQFSQILKKMNDPQPATTGAIPVPSTAWSVASPAPAPPPKPPVFDAPTPSSAPHVSVPAWQPPSSVPGPPADVAANPPAGPQPPERSLDATKAEGNATAPKQGMVIKASMALAVVVLGVIVFLVLSKARKGAGEGGKEGKGKKKTFVGGLKGLLGGRGGERDRDGDGDDESDGGAHRPETAIPTQGHRVRAPPPVRDHAVLGPRPIPPHVQAQLDARADARRHPENGYRDEYIPQAQSPIYPPGQRSSYAPPEYDRPAAHGQSVHPMIAQAMSQGYTTGLPPSAAVREPPPHVLQQLQQLRHGQYPGMAPPPAGGGYPQHAYPPPYAQAGGQQGYPAAPGAAPPSYRPPSARSSPPSPPQGIPISSIPIPAATQPYPQHPQGGPFPHPPPPHHPVQQQQQQHPYNPAEVVGRDGAVYHGQYAQHPHYAQPAQYAPQQHQPAPQPPPPRAAAQGYHPPPERQLPPQMSQQYAATMPPPPPPPAQQQQQQQQPQQ